MISILDHRAAERLHQIVSANPRLRVRVYHRRGDCVYDPCYAGWGRIGDAHYYVLEARDEISREDIWEIGSALERGL